MAKQIEIFSPDDPVVKDILNFYKSLQSEYYHQQCLSPKKGLQSNLEKKYF